MRKIIGKKNKVHYVEETTRYKMVKSHKGWLVIGTSMFALGLGVLVTSQPVSADVVATSTSYTKGAALSTVTKDNFLQYFSLNGSATYDASQGVVTLTTDDNDLVGNFSLKSKIDMNSSFTLTGQVNLGNKVSSKGGADGIGFAFHDGNTTDIGNAGGNLGIGGLIDAVGFKLDTWHNNFFTPKSALPGAQVSPNDSNGYGWSADPSDSEYPQFGGFVTTSNQEIQAIDNNSYQRWWAETDTSSVQKLKDNNLDNNFHDFVASYDSATRVLTISYTETDGNTLTWTKTIDSSSQAMALIVSASTGGAKNLQQFKITSFDFNQAATVNVKYVDTKGNQIAQGEVTYPNGANVNGTYRTTQLDIPGYTFIKMGDGSLSASGTLTQLGDNGTVTYVYTKNPVAGGNVTAKYVDTSGNAISDNVVKTGNIGDTYSTEQKTIPGYTFKEVQGSASGQFTDQEQTVTYVYTKDPVAGGSVTAKYVDTSGNAISDNVVKTGNIGDTYSTEQKTIPGYTFKEVQGSASEQFTDQEQTVTYVYTKDPVAGGSVTAKYVDTSGNAISDNVVKTGNIGDTYSTEQKTIPGYTFKEVQGSASGQFTDQEQTVTYVYTKDPVAGGSVTAKYVDTSGNAISDNVVKTGNIGDTYSTEQKTIPGYTFKEVQGSASGQFTDQEQTVTYVYTKDPVAGGNVTVKYVDGAGNTLSDNVVKSGNIGDDYSTEQKDIPGYTFKEVQGSASGQFTDQEQTVTYVYTKDPVAGGSVTAKYVDTSGNAISDNVVKTGNIGDTYSTEQKTIPGYTFKEVQGSASGQFTDQEQTVTYVYTKDPVAGGNVTVKYVDGAGNTLSDNVVKSGNIGDDYSTEQKDIPGYTFKEVQGSASGQFTDQEQTVTYVYTKDPVAGGNVTVKYVDGAGNTISDNVVKSGNIGDDYSTEQKDIPGYTFKEVQGSASGQFTDQEQTVTYVYTKDPVAGGSVLVKYVDGAGNTISDNVVKSGNIGDDYSTDQKAIPGYTFKEVQGSASGQFTDQEQTVTYVYTKDPATTASTSTTTVEPTTTVSTSTTTVEPTTTVAATTTTVEPTTTAAATTTTVEPTTTVAATTTTVEPTTTVAATTTTVEPTTTASTSTTTVEPTTTVSTSTTTVEPTTTVAATTTTVEPTTTASTSTTTVEPTTTVSTSTTTVEPTTTVAATTTTVEPTTTAAATTTTVEPTTTVAATTTTVEPTTTVAATTTTVEPTTTAAATTTTASTTTVAPTTSVTTTAATTVDVPGTTTGVTPPPAGGKKGRTLPKTGEESGLTTSLVGFALMSVASVAAVLYRKSKKA